MDKKELREKISKTLFSYETKNGKKSIDKIMDLVDNYLNKQLTLTDVSQRSELLKSFADWLQGEVWDDKHDDFSDYVEDYIKTL